jgi:hypothetical protein
LVEEGRIKKAICPDGALDLLMEEDSGQLFVSCNAQTPSSVTLSVVTDNGRVQDLELTFGDSSSEVVCLSGSTYPNSSHPYHSPLDVASLVTDVLRGVAPKGYVGRTAKRIWSRLKEGVRYSIDRIFDGPDNSIRLIRIHNSSGRVRQVQESDLECAGCQWVYLMDKKIQARASTYAVVGVEKI